MGTCERCGKRFLKVSPRSRWCADCLEDMLRGKPTWVQRALVGELPPAAFGAWAHAGVRA